MNGNAFGKAGLEHLESMLSGGMAAPTHHGLGVWWSRHWGSPTDGIAPFGPMTANAVLTEVVQGYT